ncbi:MAG TPA: hypothetical protein VGO03_04815 [Acidimicrobiia bacterium]
MTKSSAPPHTARRVATAVAGLIAVAAFAACAHPTADAATRSDAPAATAGATASPTSGPSTATAMICHADAQRDLRAILGVDTAAPVRATWHDGRYSCAYRYAHGASFTLTVQQLADRATAARFYDTTAARLGRRTTLTGLGQHAATMQRGQVVVQKDNDVLVVDPSGLPSRFGNPPDSAADVALSVAATIMGCWTG